MRTVIQAFERGVLFEKGNQARILEAGTHKYNEKTAQLTRVDLRPKLLRVTGQEILTADGVAVRCGTVLQFKIVDPLTWVMMSPEYSSPEELLHLEVQKALRDRLSAYEAADLISSRNEWAAEFQMVPPEIQSKYGVQVEPGNIRDVAFPGDLKNRFAQVALAKVESQASLERARGEQATLRSLANAARLIESNPELKSLRTLLALEKGGGQIVVKAD